MSTVRRLAVLSVAGLGSGCLLFFGAFFGCYFFHPIPGIYFSEDSQLQLAAQPYFDFYFSISTLVALLGVAVVVIYLHKRLGRKC
jgi:hypothetical protein